MVRIIFCILLVLVLLLDQPQLTKWRGVMQAPPSFFTDAYGDGSQERDGIPTYDIIYNMNMGTNHYLNPSFYYAELLPLKLMPPSREGYNFAGWYRDSRYRYPVTEITDCEDGNLILFAKWTKKISNSTNIQMYSYVTGSLTRAPEKKLSNMDYRIIENLNIPGMPATRYDDYNSKKIYSADQCPQGLCLTEDYILVTSYSTGYSGYGCLYVFDRVSGEYLVTLSMKQGSHLGGITYDGENLWVCHSDGSTIERIDYALVKELAMYKPGQVVTIPQEYEEYSVSNSPSCITFFNGRIWVATHTKFFKSVMKSYRYKDGELVEGQRFVIPDKVQGVAFDSLGHVYLSTSFGRDKSSYVKVYESAYALSKNPEKPAECVEMPPCSEELAIVGEELFVLFESGAQKYMEGTDGGGKALAPLDHIVAIHLNSF